MSSMRSADSGSPAASAAHATAVASRVMSVAVTPARSRSSSRTCSTSLANAHVAAYIPSDPYRASWQRLGFTDADFANGGSDRLVDALVAVGEEAMSERVAAHLASGADHVCLQALPATVGAVPLDQWRLLAPVAARPPSRNVVA
jgi:hypothetical protein